MTHDHARRGESGNVMLYIFAAIALLAALTYAVSHSGRASVSDLTEDRVRLLAGEVISYGDTAAKGATVLRLRGVTANMIDMNNNLQAGYDNPACTSSDCALFDPAGGGVNFVPPPKDWLDAGESGQTEYGHAYFDAQTCVPYVGSGESDCNTNVTDDEELVMFVPFVRKDLCLKINEFLSIPNTGNDAPVVSDCTFGSKFTGTYSENSIIDATDLNGKTAGCYRYTTGCTGMDDTYHYYQVLIAR